MEKGANLLFLDSASRLISCIIDEERDQTPAIVRQVGTEIAARREFLSVDPAVYVESLDDLIRVIARDMMARAAPDESTTE